MRRLYKVTAHCGSKTHDYFVVASSSTKAEEKVESVHRDNNWSSVDYYYVHTIATDNPYGEPAVLIVD